MYVLLGILIFFTLMLYMQFLGYPLLMSWFISVNKNKIKKDYSYHPFLSIIIPTYREEKVIGRRINDLLSQDYPADKYEIIVVDSGSDDKTVSIAHDYQKQHSNIIIIEEGKRNGKASAINLGKKSAKGDIILVTDANDIFNNDVLKEMVPYFANPKVGAVGGHLVCSNPENNLVKASSFYFDIESLLTRGETIIDSACNFHGEINAWRKDIVDADKGTLTEDLDMAVQIRRSGYKIIYEHDAICFEPGPTTATEQITQKKRTIIGTIQVYFKHKSYFWMPHDLYSVLIFPMHKTLQIFSPYLILGILATFIPLMILNAYLIALIYGVVTLLLFTISLIILINKLNATKIANTRDNITRNPFGIIKFVLLHEFIILYAWKDFLTKKYTVTWKKAETTRD